MTETSLNDNSQPLTLALHSRIQDIPEQDWDACAGSDNPFINHAFLSILEESGSTGPETGWLPQHVSLRTPQGQIAAVVPLYVKLHSYGEYVFDQTWAEAFERVGGAYYPKLQNSVPFSPVPGPRLLRHPAFTLTYESMGEALTNLCRQLKMSSFHVTFCTEPEWTALGRAGWLQRLGVQFHWHNKGYTSFEDFLASLSSGHRKSIRRERRDIQKSGLVFHTLSGSSIETRHWDAFYTFYLATTERKWGSAYLTRDFFTRLSERLGDKVILMMAEHEDRLVAGALNLVGRDTLYGRNWGCVGHWPFLHFELCYYRALDYAIEKGLKYVEAGAQGTHKIQRGYLPEPTYSAHWIAHQGFSEAVKSFLDEERKRVQSDMDDLGQLAPFKISEATP